MGRHQHSPGKYHTTTYNLLSMNRIKSGRTEHIIDISINYQTGKADEYRQKIIEKDPVTGIESSYWNTLLTYDERYTVDLLTPICTTACCGVIITLEKPQPTQARAYFQIGRRSIQSLRLHRLQSDRQPSAWRADIHSCANNRSLWIEAEAGYHISRYHRTCHSTIRPLNTPKVCFYPT